MREALKNAFGKEIILKDGTVFLYTVQPFEIKNILGQIVDVLEEYSFTNMGGTETYKVYRTKEENWYEINQPNISSESNRISDLKVAINKQKEHQILD